LSPPPAAPAAPASLGVVALAIVAGAAQAASFAPLQWWPLQILGLALLVALAQRAGSTWRAMATGWAFGFGWLASGLWWLYISMHDFGGMPAPLAAAAVALLAGLLALYYGLATAVWWKLFAQWPADLRRPAWPVSASALGFAGCWTLAELARAMLFTGFPWIAGGYAHTDSPLAAWAPWIGVYGIGAIAAWGGAAIGLVLPLIVRGAAAIGGSIGMLTMAAPMLLMLGGMALPQAFTEPAGTLRVSLIQTNVPQDLKFDPVQAHMHLQSLAEQLAAAQGEVVITPESVLPLPLAFMPPPDWQALTAPFTAGSGRAALIGVFLGNDTDGYVNSMVGVPPADPASADLYRYGKRHLLPFGEFIPPGFGWFVRMMNIPLGDQEHGRTEAAWAVAGQRLRPLICYEDLFGEDFAGSAAGEGAATVLVNTANLAWFGLHMVQDQHLQFSRMRALEFQRPVVRATNTGATAVVDHLGRVTHRLPPLQRAVLEAQVQGRSGSTPYARWLAALGLAPLVAACGAALVMALGLRRIGRP
jgi:apolipoprotein N-acyltransferase